MEHAQDNEYTKNAPSVLAKAKKLLASKSWVYEMSKSDVALSRLSVVDCPFPAYHVQGKYSKSKEEMVNKIWGVESEEMAKRNDPKLVTWECVERGLNWKVISQTNGVIWPAWSRHILFSQVRIDEGSHTYLVGTSVDRPDVKTVSGHVRANVHMSVYDYCDNGDGTTTVDRITLLDPSGSIPVSLVTMYSGNLLNLFASWKNE